MVVEVVEMLSIHIAIIRMKTLKAVVTAILYQIECSIYNSQALENVRLVLLNSVIK